MDANADDFQSSSKSHKKVRSKSKVRLHYNYSTKGEENFTSKGRDILIPKIDDTSAIIDRPTSSSKNNSISYGDYDPKLKKTNESRHTVRFQEDVNPEDRSRLSPRGNNRGRARERSTSPYNAASQSSTNYQTVSTTSNPTDYISRPIEGVNNISRDYSIPSYTTTNNSTNRAANLNTNDYLQRAVTINPYNTSNTPTIAYDSSRQSTNVYPDISINSMAIQRIEPSHNTSQFDTNFERHRLPDSSFTSKAYHNGDPYSRTYSAPHPAVQQSTTVDAWKNNSNGVKGANTFYKTGQEPINTLGETGTYQSYSSTNATSPYDLSRKSFASTSYPYQNQTFQNSPIESKVPVEVEKKEKNQSTNRGFLQAVLPKKFFKTNDEKSKKPDSSITATEEAFLAATINRRKSVGGTQPNAPGAPVIKETFQKGDNQFKPQSLNAHNGFTTRSKTLNIGYSANQRKEVEEAQRLYRADLEKTNEKVRNQIKVENGDWSDHDEEVEKFMERINQQIKDVRKMKVKKGHDVQKTIFAKGRKFSFDETFNNNDVSFADPNNFKINNNKNNINSDVSLFIDNLVEAVFSSIEKKDISKTNCENLYNHSPTANNVDITYHSFSDSAINFFTPRNSTD